MLNQGRLVLIIAKLKFHGLGPNNHFRIACDLALKEAGIKANYISEDIASLYYNRIVETNDSSAFFATEKTYHAAFQPQNHYVFLKTDIHNLSRTFNLYYKAEALVSIDIEQMIILIRNAII